MRYLVVLTIGMVFILGCNDNEKAVKRAHFEQHIREQIEMVKQKASEYQFDDAKKIFEICSEELREDHLLNFETYNLLNDEVNSLIISIREQEYDYSLKVKHGWKVIGIKLVSPEEQEKALAEEQVRMEQARHEKELKEKAEQERIQRQKEAEESKMRREREDAERKQKEEQARQIAEQARKMYPAYKAGSEAVCNELLRIISAIEVGVSYPTYTEMIQKLNFEWNKFELRCSSQERAYESYLHLWLSVSRFKMASDLWDLRIKYPRQWTIEDDEKLQEHWKQGQEEYGKAMAALVKGE